MSGLTRDGTVEPVSRDQILKRKRGRKQKKLCSADQEQDRGSILRLIHTRLKVLMIQTVG